MEFTGDPLEDCCPITLTVVKDIRHPVGLEPNHAYECDALVDWVTKGDSRNPLTMELLHGKMAEIATPLIVGNNQHMIAETYMKLRQAGETKVTCPDGPLPTIDDSSFQATKVAMRFDRAFWTSFQAIAFVVVTYVVAMLQKTVSISSFTYSHFGALATVVSFGQLVFGTYQAYPTNGKWIVLNFCVVMFFNMKCLKSSLNYSFPGWTLSLHLV